MKDQLERERDELAKWLGLDWKKLDGDRKMLEDELRRWNDALNLKLLDD